MGCHRVRNERGRNDCVTCPEHLAGGACTWREAHSEFWNGAKGRRRLLEAYARTFEKKTEKNEQQSSFSMEMEENAKQEAGSVRLKLVLEW